MASGVRRITDAVVASIALVVLAPLCLAIATAILLEGGEASSSRRRAWAGAAAVSGS
jgi:lipopolysaccharide/colanic/teichoic acid biosynthesis glycosyltransferase